VFHLRDGVKFHDGSDLNADTVVWNVKRMVQNPKSFAKPYLLAVDENDPASALDPMTVQVNLTRPSSAVLSSLSDAGSNGGGTTAIVSKKAADDHGEDWLKLNPVGTGPFRFVSFNSGDKLVVQRNDNYWVTGADGKATPYVDGVTYRVIIEATTQFNEMRAGTAELGRVRLTWTVIGSSAEAGSFSSIASRYGLAKLLGFWTIRFTFHTTVSAFRSEPSWNLTPSRRWNTILSPEVSQLLASIGWAA
jgi:ABC-type transport system substrate-binding protein